MSVVPFADFLRSYWNFLHEQARTVPANRPVLRPFQVVFEGRKCLCGPLVDEPMPWHGTRSRQGRSSPEARRTTTESFNSIRERLLGRPKPSSGSEEPAFESEVPTLGGANDEPRQKYAIYRVLVDPAPVWPVSVSPKASEYVRMHGTPKSLLPQYRAAKIRVITVGLGSES